MNSTEIHEGMRVRWKAHESLVLTGRVLERKGSDLRVKVRGHELWIAAARVLCAWWQ